MKNRAMDEFDDNPFAAIPARRPFWLPTLRALALLAICAGAVYGLNFASRQWLMNRLADNLEAHPASIRDERLRMLAEFEEDALPALFQVILSPDEPLAAAAFRTVTEMQNRWRIEGPTAHADGLTILVEQVAAATSNCPPARRPWLSELLSQVVVDTVDSDNETASKCYLRAAKLLASLGPPSTLSDGDLLPPRLARQEPRGRVLDDRSNPDMTNGNGVMPTDPRRLDPLPIRLQTTANNPNQTSGNDDLSSELVPATPQLFTPPSVTLETPTENASSKVDSNLDAAIVQVSSTSALSSSPLAVYDTRSVIEFVTSSQPNLREHAIAELQQRGFSSSEIEVAQRFMATDARTRLTLVEELPKRSDIDPRNWLIWLAADAERDVRLAAVSQLGAIADPDIRDALRERLRDERDPTVATRIRRFLGLR